MRPPVRSLRRVHILDPSAALGLCRQCTSRPPRIQPLSLSPPSRLAPRRNASSVPSARLSANYFLPNNLVHRVTAQRHAPIHNDSKSSATAASFFASTSSAKETTPPPGVNADLPHRRRQAARRKAAADAAAVAGGSGASSSSTAGTSPSDSEVLPSQDASSALASIAASHPTQSLRRSFSAFLSLAKPRLTVLVVLTSMASYALYPVPSFLTPAVTESPSLSPLTLLFLTTGTALCSAAANSLNMLYEPATDARMSRTRNRPLVRNLISRRGAVLFALATAATGTAALYFGVNPTVAFLGAANIVLYAGVYTPLKAVTVANTWVGALVGGIPPLMGWAAAAGESATGDGTWRELLLAHDGGSLGGWILAAFLFAWQFPHFMALSWSIRDEYRAAGLRMLAWTNPARNARVALRYSIAFVPLCLGLCAAGVTEWSFALTSSPVNGWLIWQAVRFWRYDGYKGSARGLFWASVWHLPVVMVLALVQKKGMWSRVWRSIVGYDDDDDEWIEDELDEMPVVSPSSKT
ncbi:hypothetical protein ACRALDRAFT_1064318 [Sodiomyces alcalophilus JCM 7366]|uniref:uncharacterized protein n=1 Tax=Sodiomyces alcalophilus JCM 7366 TaxID=591952 RepID=UPI0039B40E37